MHALEGYIMRFTSKKGALPYLISSSYEGPPWVTENASAMPKWAREILVLRLASR